MNAIFLSHFMNEQSPNFGGTQGIKINQIRSIDRGDSSNKIEFSTNNHFGTHIDFPKHFIPGGKSLSDYSAQDLIFNQVTVLDLPLSNDELIFSSHLKNKAIRSDCDFLLVRSGFEKFRGQNTYWNNNPGLTPELGSYLKTNFPALKCIGFDFISASAFQHRDVGRDAHASFLGSENGSPILILEDMKLAELSFDPNQVIVSPLLIDQADGIQVTVIALK